MTDLRRLAVAASLALLPALAGADILVLKDGKHVQGTVAETGNGYAVTTKYGTLTVPKEQVRKVIPSAAKVLADTEGLRATAKSLLAETAGESTDAARNAKRDAAAALLAQARQACAEARDAYTGSERTDLERAVAAIDAELRAAKPEGGAEASGLRVVKPPEMPAVPAESLEPPPPPDMPEPEPAKPARLPEPDAAAQRTAEQKIRQLFSDAYARRTADDRLELSRRLLREAHGTDDDPVARFVLLREAADLAAQAGDTETAAAAIDRMAAGYEVDAVALKTKAIMDAARAVRTPEAAGRLAQAALALIDPALEADAYDAAANLVGRAESAARQARDAALLDRARARRSEISALRNAYRLAASALRTLETRPDDPAANLAAGRFFCLTKGDWERGLPMLAKGSDADLRALAKQELSPPATVDGQVALGDGWWDAASGKGGEAKSRLQERAVRWYETALPGLQGLQQLKLTKRVESYYQAGGTGSVPRNGLVFWVEPNRSPANPFRELVSGAKPTVTHCELAPSGVRAFALAKSAIDYPASDRVRAVSERGSIVVWFKTRSPKQRGGLVDRHFKKQDDISLWVFDGRFGARPNFPATKGWPRLLSKGRIEADAWVCGGVTWEGGQLRMYLDGKPDSVHPCEAPRRVGTVVNLGSNPGGSPNYFRGLVGQVLIYDRPLSAAEMGRIHASGRRMFR